MFTDNSVPAPANEMMFIGSTASTHFEIGSLETSGNPRSSIDIKLRDFTTGVNDISNVGHIGLHAIVATIALTDTIAIVRNIFSYWTMKNRQQKCLSVFI
ncbi:MAG: hypothetical protein ACOH2J_04025 [Allorhizobium sp.]